MMNFLLKNKIVIFLLAYLCISVNGQNDDNHGLRSLGHKRTGIVEPVYVDNPVIVEQPVYYTYPYAYPYSYTYQYPYAYPYQTYQQYYYPYNYSYTYSRTTSRPGRYSAPLGVIPAPPPYLRYLGQKPIEEPRNFPSENVAPNMNAAPIMENEFVNPALRQNEVYYPMMNENGIHEPIFDDRFPRDPLMPGFNDFPPRPQFEPFNNTSVPNAEKPASDSQKKNNTSDNSSANAKLRALASKGIIDRVEKTVNKVFDNLKQNNSTEISSNSTDEQVDQPNNQTSNGKNMIKQVFSTIENIVSTTITS